jgi:tRNA A37 methylthiotransferase MiaB
MEVSKKMSSKAQLIIKSCSKRELEIDQMKNFLEGNGFSVEETYARLYSNIEEEHINKGADLIIFSTCAFSNVTEQSNITDIELIQKIKKPSAELVVCGCLPMINPGLLSSVFSGPTYGPRSHEKLNEIIKADKKYSEFSHQNVTHTFGKNVFVIQIHEGCPCNCSYCAIKFSIGSLKSKPINDILIEFQRGLNRGYKNFILSGDCVSNLGTG